MKAIANSKPNSRGRIPRSRCRHLVWGSGRFCDKVGLDDPAALLGAAREAIALTNARGFDMLLTGYRLAVFNNACMPGALSVNCHAHLDQDVSEALPYLNTVLGGFEYIRDPPAVTFKAQGKLITVHGRMIAVNALKDENEARKIVDWLVREINAAWDDRETITPCYAGQPRPQLIEILKRLPRTNCRECGRPTCLVFAAQAAEGAVGAGGCPPLAGDRKAELDAYLAGFDLG